MLDEQEFLTLAADAWRRVLAAIDRLDPEDVDADARTDVVNITLKDGSRLVLNTQRPVRQIWLAGGGRGWHFDWDAATERWLDAKGSGDELYATLARLVKAGSGRDLVV
ncbi:MAG: iron donor protein CyaY [Deltaproteobacteria bacterium]|nr:iron donor protein CyaY [Deltaproteobacteria bacterium]